MSPLQLAALLNVSLCISLFLCGARRYKRGPQEAQERTLQQTTEQTSHHSRHHRTERERETERVYLQFVYESFEDI